MFEGKQNTRKENVAVCSVAAAKVSRGAAKRQRRLLRAGLYQWKRRVDHHGYLRELSDRITQGRQRRLLQQAWDRYTGFLEYCQQHDRNVASASDLTRTLEDRMLRRHFNAYCAFANRQRRARKYFGRILSRMDLWMKSRYMERWRENGNEKVQYELNTVQNSDV